MRGLPAVEVVHVDVEEYRIGSVLLQDLQAFAAAGCLAHDEAQRQQQAGQQLPLDGLVVHHEQGAARVEVADDGTQVAQGARDRGLDLAQIQAHAEGAALAHGAAQCELTAHEAGEQTGDGQAQAGSRFAGTPSGAAALEGLEDALLVLRGDADASVFHLEAHHFVSAVHAQHDSTPVGEAHGVAQQVDEDLAQALGVGLHPSGYAALGFEAEREALALGLGLHHAREFGKEFLEGQRRWVQPQAAGLDACKIEQAVDQCVHVLSALLDGCDGLARAALKLAAAQQDLRIAQDAVEGRAQLVRHTGHVARLGLTRVLGHLLGALQRGVGALVGVDFLLQQLGLSLRFVVRHAPAFVGQHQPPGPHCGQQSKQRKHLDEGTTQRVGRRGQALLHVDHTQHKGHDGAKGEEDREVLADAEVEAVVQAGGQDGCERGAHLVSRARLGLAAIMAA